MKTIETYNSQELADAGIMPVAIVGQTPFKTHFNRAKFPDRGEINTKPSMTIPDQSLSVQELVYRYTHGLELGNSRVGTYEEDGEIEFPANWDKLDLSERHEFFEEKREELEKLQAKLQAEKNALVEKQKKEELEKAVNEKLKAIRDARNPDRTQGELPLEKDGKE